MIVFRRSPAGEPILRMRHPAGLSGGQLQRAALARALLARPRLPICDEITTALECPQAQRILDHLENYRRATGAAVLLLSHDLAGLLSRADRLVVIDEGRIAAIGTPPEVLADRETTVLARLLAADGLSGHMPVSPLG